MFDQINSVAVKPTFDLDLDRLQLSMEGRLTQEAVNNRSTASTVMRGATGDWIKSLSIASKKAKGLKLDVDGSGLSVSSHNSMIISIL